MPPSSMCPPGAPARMTPVDVSGHACRCGCRCVSTSHFTTQEVAPVTRQCSLIGIGGHAHRCGASSFKTSSKGLAFQKGEYAPGR